MIEFDESVSRKALEDIFNLVKGSLPMKAEDAAAQDIVALVRDALDARDRRIADLTVTLASMRRPNGPR